MNAASITKELEEWRGKRDDLFKGDAWVRKLQFDKDAQTVSFEVDLDYTEEYIPITIIIVSEKIYNVVREDDIKEIHVDSITDCLQQIFEGFEKERDDALDLLQTPGTAAVTDDDQFGGDSEEEIEAEITPTSGLNGDEDDQTRMLEISASLAQVCKTDGWFGVSGASGLDQIRIYLLLDPRKRLGISELVASAWGIDLHRYICLSLTFSNYYLESNAQPVVNAFQCGDTSNSNTNLGLLLDNKVKFGLYWTIEQRIGKEFFQKYWPIEKYASEEQRTGNNYMESILLFTEDAIRESPNHCIICSGKLPHLGLKPTVCDSPLCVFSHEQYGLGVDLESMILKSPEIVDLLITMCYAACSQQQLGYHRSNFNPFDPFPRGLEIKVKNEKTGQIDVLSFMKGDDRDNKSVSEVLNLIPTIEQLTCWVIDGKLKDHCDELHMLMYPLLRWIMASNRSHLKKLEKHEQISEMQTEHQYLMMSSPPEKEKRFQELKRKYGSVYAFHGSALRNWHSILRVGLKNMSGTAGQMNGAAFGSGVYLAPHSSTSAGYMQFFQGWPKSTLFSKNLGCMAVCEIITKKDEVKQPKPHYVIPNEELIQARYFMIYDARCAANADGGKLRPPDIDWA